MSTNHRERSLRKALRITIVVGVVLAPALGVRAEQDKIYTTYPPGTLSCGRWTSEHQTSEQQLTASSLAPMMNGWVSGYISGVNMMLVVNADTNGGKTLKAPDGAGLTGWVTQYCGEHPLDSISVAAGKLAAELANR